MQTAEPYITFAPGLHLDYQVFALVTIPILQSGREYTDVSLPGFTSRPEQYYGDCEVVH